MVELRQGKVKVTGQGETGWHREVKKADWRGEALKFLISPKLLGNLVEKGNECTVMSGKLRVDGGGWIYVACLVQVGEEGNQENGEMEEKQEEKPRKKKQRVEVEE